MKRFQLAIGLAALLSVGCRDQELLQPSAPGAPMAVIMDGANNGNPFFFFLPPLVPNPNSFFHAGTFNAGLSPVAEVCELTGDPGLPGPAPTCVATVFGPAQMTLDQSNEHYHVNWDTKASPLVSTKFYRILVRGAPQGSVLGFVDVDPVDQGMKNLKTGDVVPFQDGRTLPIKVRIEQQAFGTTNPDHVEQVVTNRIPAGTFDVTTNTGFAGARFSDDWLPRAAVAAGIDQVVVTIERIPVQNATLDASCLQSGLKELEGCYRFRTDPDLTEFGTFFKSVIAGICVEIPIVENPDAEPFQMHRRRESEGAPTGETFALPSAAAPFLTCDAFTPTPPSISQAIRSGSLGELANASWHALVRGVGRLVQPRALYAVDFGAGGSTDGFSRFGWARAATMVKVPITDNQVAFAGTKVLLDPTVCLLKLHPAPRPLVSEPVTFTPSNSGTVNGSSDGATVVTGEDGCAHVEWVLGPSGAGPSGPNNTLLVTAATHGSPQTFTATGLTFTSMDAGERQTCAVASSGAAYCWGSNAFGQLGNGGTSDADVPTPVAAGFALRTISTTTAHTCALGFDGRVSCWGRNSSGQLGDGTTTDRATPIAVSGGLTFVAVSTGGLHTCALTASGAAYCWGANDNGQLGTGNTLPSSAPVPVSGGTVFTTISAGFFHTCALRSDGAAFCWGRAIFGAIGNGSTSGPVTTPVPVSGGLAFTQITSGAEYTCGPTAAGAAYCWGNNAGGQLGFGPPRFGPSVPTPVSGGLTFVALSAANENNIFGHTCGITMAGVAYCWGGDFSGELGAPTSETCPGFGGNAPLPCATSPLPVSGGRSFVQIAEGIDHTCAIAASGEAYCWGGNNRGQLGNGTTTASSTPVLISNPASVSP